MYPARPSTHPAFLLRPLFLGLSNTSSGIPLSPKVDMMVMLFNTCEPSLPFGDVLYCPNVDKRKGLLFTWYEVYGMFLARRIDLVGVVGGNLGEGGR